MVGARMIGDLVLDQFEPALMHGVRQLAKPRHVSQVLLHGVKVHSAIAVVIGDGTTGNGALIVVRVLFACIQMVDVVVPWSEPKRGNTEIAKVGETIDDTLQIASVII